MVALPRKAKHFLVFIAKLLVVGGAFYFIYNRIANDENLDWQHLSHATGQKHAGWLIFGILLCTFLNRFLEIFKWQNLVNSFVPLSFARAADQVFAAVTAGVFTPNGVGEYAAKALYYKKDQAKQIIFLNLICNGIQMVIAIVLGLAGLIVFNALYNVVPTTLLLIILGIIAAIIITVFASRKITIKGYSLHLLFTKINELPKPTHRKNMLLATGRYLSIIHQHYLIFLAFGVHLPYPVMISAIAGVYFLGSALPNFQFLDFAVRGSVAVFFFGKMGVTEWIVIFAATLQWLLNIVIPVTIGSYYVLRFKSVRVATTAAPHQE